MPSGNLSSDWLDSEALPLPRPLTHHVLPPLNRRFLWARKGWVLFTVSVLGIDVQGPGAHWQTAAGPVQSRLAWLWGSQRAGMRLEAENRCGGETGREGSDVCNMLSDRE